MPGELTAKPKWFSAQNEAFKCTFAGCKDGFPSAYELRVHKHVTPDHFFCLEDDYEAKDWEDMARHLAQSRQHNACPACSNNSHVTIGGLRLHILMDHKGRRNCKCYGCGVNYLTPEALWGHLDKEEVPAVCVGPMHGKSSPVSY